VLVFALMAIGVLVLVLWPVKVPYFALSPGPVEEVSDLVNIDEVETHAPTGELFLLTVGLREVNLFEYVEAHFDETVDLIEREVIRPEGVTQEQVTRTNLQLMDESIDTAIFVALARAGYEVGFLGDGVEVLDTVEGSPGEGALVIGDVVYRVDGVEVSTAEEAAALIRSYQIGDTITLSGVRDGSDFDADITLVAHPDLEGAPMVGVLFDTVNLQIDLPIGVRVDSRNIGGPSAGMMYALTVLDLLTEDDLTRGHRIAGTGTIRFDETIGPVGGVRQKVYAARAVDAEYVLVPVDNYEDAITAAGDSIEVVPVETLQDALDFLASLAPVEASLAAG
jgi:PDZ domain-containing protein